MRPELPLSPAHYEASRFAAIRSPEKIPAILLTGETTREFTGKAAAEDIAVLHKPISPSHLHTALRPTFAADGEGLNRVADRRES